MDWFIRFNLMREKDIISEHSNIFSGIIIDAHILETFPNASANFLGRQKIPFIIDPVTYKFSIYNSINLYAEKRWYPLLMDRFLEGIVEGDLFEKDQPLSPDDLDGDDIKNYVGKIIYYQRSRVNGILEGLEIFEEFPNLIPNILVPPYSIITSKNDLWINSNLQCIEESIKIKRPDEKIYPVIPIYKDLLHHEMFIDSLVSQYNIKGIDGYFVWIANFKEEREDESSLINYVKLFTKLKLNNKPIINFYGGYFSTVLSSLKLMQGVTSGLGYGEYRNPFSAGGPVPYSYYFVPFHTQIPTDDVTPILNLSDKFSKCDCKYCKKYTDLADIQLMESIKHLLHKKIEERIFLDENKLNIVIKKLMETYKIMEELDSQRTYFSHYNHLMRWNTVLMDLQKKTIKDTPP